MSHDHPALKASPSRVGGAYEVATFKKLEGGPNWALEWITDDQLAKAAYERSSGLFKRKLNWNRRFRVC